VREGNKGVLSWWGKRPRRQGQAQARVGVEGGKDGGHLAQARRRRAAWDVRWCMERRMCGLATDDGVEGGVGIDGQMGHA
jgi:hypothetical protein